MKNELRFSAGGLEVFAKVVLSCFPVHYELNLQAMEYLKEVVAGEIPLNAKILLDKIPALKKSVLAFAHERGYLQVSKEAVLEFFAGDIHYEKILLDFEEYKLHIVPGSVFSLRTMFAHLVTPVEVLGLEADGFVGRYQKGGFDFLVRGLVATNKDRKALSVVDPQNPKTVLVHFSTIIEVEPRKHVVEKIRLIQESLRVFTGARKHLQANGGVDYNRFPANCRQKTQKALEKINL